MVNMTEENYEDVEFKQFKVEKEPQEPDKIGKIEPRTLTDEEIQEKLMSDYITEMEEGLEQLKIDPDTQDRKSVPDAMLEDEGLKPMDPKRPPTYIDSPSGPLKVVKGAWVVVCGNCDLRYSHYHGANKQFKEDGYKFSTCSHCGTLNRIPDTT